VAASNARAAGITIFVSAGNYGYCDSTSKPGCMSNTVNVGAVYDSSFGRYQPCVSIDSCVQKFQTNGCGDLGNYAVDETEADRVPSYSNSAPFLTLLAPANMAYTTDISGTGGYASGNYRSNFGGTSAACPYAAGAAACVQSASLALYGVYLSPEDLEAYLIDNGDPITDEKSNLTTNRINLRKAILALESNTAPSISAPTSLEITD
jgi:subtilisin family serine protease